MNVPVPLSENPHGFLMAMIISAILSCVMAFIFWKKRYF